MFKKVIWFLAFILLLIGISFFTAILNKEWLENYMVESNVKTLQKLAKRFTSLKSTSSEPILVWWPEQPLLIPANYLEMPPQYVALNKVARSMNGNILYGRFAVSLIAELPSIGPRSEQNRQNLDKNGKFKNTLRVFLQSKFNVSDARRSEIWQDKNPIEGWAQIIRDSKMGRAKIEGITPKQLNDLHGLRREVINTRMGSTLLYKRNAENYLVTFIECHLPNTVPHPHCSQNFYYKPLDASVKIGYSSEHLKHWKSIQEKIQLLLASFITSKENATLYGWNENEANTYLYPPKN